VSPHSPTTMRERERHTHTHICLAHPSRVPNASWNCIPKSPLQKRCKHCKCRTTLAHSHTHKTSTLACPASPRDSERNSRACSSSSTSHMRRLAPHQALSACNFHEHKTTHSCQARFTRSSPHRPRLVSNIWQFKATQNNKNGFRISHHQIATPAKRTTVPAASTQLE
jgi:hypothetical protein